MIDFEQPPHIEIPKHGGRLKEAIAESDFPEQEWLDLSTGINPNAWPVPNLPAHTFQRLPEPDNALEKAAYHYYLSDSFDEKESQLLAIPGSQWFIQHFPLAIKRLMNQATLDVLLPTFGFSEHAFWWHQHQHNIHRYNDSDLSTLLNQTINANIIVIINPNNPTTHLTPKQDILNAAYYNPETLFIIDEAFIDSRQHESLLTASRPKNMIVMRSLGKFFGLAGLRVGFVFSDPYFIGWLSRYLGPWPIANPSRWVATHALRDSDWQADARDNLISSMGDLAAMMEATLSGSAMTFRCSDFFLTLDCESQAQAKKLHTALKQQAVLTRLIENTSLIRFGLPANTHMTTLEERLRRVFKPG